VGVHVATLGGLLLFGASSAAPHPHLTVEYTVELLVGPRGPDGVRLTSTVDLANSSPLIDVFDADRNGVLSPAEVRRVEEYIRQEQGPARFFTAVTLDGELIPTPTPQSFGASIDRGQLRYHFVLPLPTKGAPRGTVEVVVDDPVYYVAFNLAQSEPIKVRGSPSFGAECRVTRERVEYLRDVVKCTYARRGS
jgi:ABC-type uncharacterized transport system substrate-binding protein